MADLTTQLGLPTNYNLSTFEKDISTIKPRFFDTYILPPFVLLYAYKSKGMSRTARRMLFVAGIYMIYRSYTEYKNIASTIAAQIKNVNSL